MPRISVLGVILWALTLIAQPMLAAALFKSGRARRWPSFFIYLMFYSLRSISLAILYRVGNTAAYFYVYWVTAAAGIAIHGWILSQVATALIFPLNGLRRWAQVAAINAIVVAFAIGFYISLQVHGPFYMHITQMVVAFERSTSLAWCIAFLFVAIGADIVGLKWMPEVLCLGLGFALNSLGNMSWAWIVSLVGYSSVPYMDDVRGIIYLISLATWSGVVYRPSTLELPREFNKRISSALGIESSTSIIEKDSWR